MGDYRGDEINQPREEDIDLLWLDYKAAEIAKECEVEWKDIPKCIKAVYIAGAAGLIVVTQASLFFMGKLFKPVASTDAFADLKWFGGKDAFFRPAGIIIVALLFLSWAGKNRLTRWKAKHVAERLPEINQRLDDIELTWKADRLKESKARKNSRMSALATVELVEKESLTQEGPPPDESDARIPLQVTHSFSCEDDGSKSRKGTRRSDLSEA